MLCVRRWFLLEREKRSVNKNVETKLVVNNQYIKAIHPKMSIYAMKLFRIVITQCRMKDDRFYSYDFKVKDLSEMIGVEPSNLYRTADEITTALMQMILKIGGETPRDSYRKMHIFDYCEYDAKRGTISIQLHEDMTELFLNLRRNFTQIPIIAILSMQSKYGIRLYELICGKLMGHYPYADTYTIITLSLAEIRTATNTDKVKAYDKISNLKTRVLLPAIADIEKCADWKVLIKDVKESRRVIGFELTIWDRNGFEVVEDCKRRGVLPPRPHEQVPGQRSLFDLYAMDTEED